MRATTFLKNLSLATGTYRLARKVHKHTFDRARLRNLPQEVALYRRMIPDGALCFDVGANIGERTEALLQAGCRVIAFEPLGHVARELSARCHAYANYELISTALGPCAGFAPIYIRAAHGQSGLLAQWEGTAIGTATVPVLTLDLAIRHFGVPYYCKIDVEGYELEVLKGLTAAIPMISLEYHVTQTDIEKTLQCVTHLEALGMRYANFTLAESPQLVLPSWRSLENFSSWLPALLALQDAGSYGDLWLRADSQLAA